MSHEKAAPGAKGSIAREPRVATLRIAGEPHSVRKNPEDSPGRKKNFGVFNTKPSRLSNVTTTIPTHIFQIRPSSGSENGHRDAMINAAAQFLHTKRSIQSVKQKYDELMRQIMVGLKSPVNERILIQAIRKLDFCCDLAKGVDVSVLRLDLASGAVEESNLGDEEIFSHTDGSKTVLVRDDRAKAAIPKEAGQAEAWKMQFLNMYLSAFDIVNHNIVDHKRKAAMTNILQNAIAGRFEIFSKAIASKSGKECHKLLKEEQKLLVGFFRDNKIKDSGKKLNFTKDWQGFKFDNCDALISLSPLDMRSSSSPVAASGKSDRYRAASEEELKSSARRYLMQSEFACKIDLTESQRAEILSCEGNSSPKWYRDMSTDQKKIFLSKRESILAGRFVIPTQLISFIPSIRNAYVKRVSVMTASEATTLQEESKESAQEGLAFSLTTLQENFHSGAVTSLAKDEKEAARLSAQNVVQLRFIAQEMARRTDRGFGSTEDLPSSISSPPAREEVVLMVVNSLNSKKSFNNNDVKIVKRTEAACAVQKADFVATPLNGFRRIIGKDYDAINGILSHVANSIPQSESDLGMFASKELTNIANYIRTGKDAKKAIAALDNAKREGGTLAERPNDIKIIELAIKLRSAMGENRVFDKENSRLRVSALTTVLAQEINDRRGDATSFFTNSPYIFIARSCKSGKDRTGLAEAYTSALALHEKYGIDIKYAMQVVVNSGHYQVIPGSSAIVGGTIGCRGTKGENRAGFPKSLRDVCEPIIEITSKGNKIKIKDKEGVSGLATYATAARGGVDSRVQALEQAYKPATPPKAITAIKKHSTTPPTVFTFEEAGSSKRAEKLTGVPQGAGVGPLKS